MHAIMLSSTKDRQHKLDDMKQTLRTNNRREIKLRFVLFVNRVTRFPAFCTMIEWLEGSEAYKYKHFDTLKEEEEERKWSIYRNDYSIHAW